MPHILLLVSLLCMWISPHALGAQSTTTDSEKIITVIPADFPPQYLLDNKGNASGFAVELLNAISTKANISIEYIVKPTWSGVFSAIESGEAVLIPNVGISEERSKILDFTTPIEQLPISIFVTSDNSSIHSIEDLFGKKVVVVKNNVAIQTLKKHPEIDLMLVKDVEDGFTPLLTRKVAAIIYPDAWVWARAVKAGIADHIKTTGQPLMYVTRSMAVKKGHQALLKKLEDALIAYLPSEEYKTLEARWKYSPTQVEIPPASISILAFLIGLLLAFSAVWLGLIRKKPQSGSTDIRPDTYSQSKFKWQLTANSRAMFMIIIIVIVTIGSVLSATYMFYQSAFESTRQQLISDVKKHKSTMQALILYEEKLRAADTSMPHTSVIEDFVQLISNNRSENNSQELELAKRNGDQIEFLFSHHKTQTGTAETVLFHSQNAEPMRLALQGKSGTVIGRDYKGEIVLAAYEPIAGKNMGLVEKIDIAAIRAPFITSAIQLSVIVSLLVTAATYLITRLGNPIILNLKKSQQELSHTIQQLYLHYNQHLVGMMTFDKAGHVTEWNMACERIFGYSHEEAMGHYIGDLILQDVSPNSMLNLWQELINQSGGKHRINDNNTKSGAKITCEWFNSPIFDVDSKVIGISSIVFDITEKAAAIEALERDKERCLLLLELIENFTEKENDFIHSALKSSTQLTNSKIGYIHLLCEDGENIDSFYYDSATNTNSTPLYEQADSNSDTSLADKIHQAAPLLQNDYTRQKKNEMLPTGNQTITRHICIPIIHKESNVGIIGVANKDGLYTIEDIKQLRLYVQSMWNIIIHRRTQKKLAESQTHYRSLVESSAAIPWEFDLCTNRFTYVGPQAIKVLGYPVDAWYEEDFWPNHLHPSDAAAAIEYCKACSMRGEDHNFKYRMIAHDGSEVWLLDYVKVIMDGDHPSHLQGFMFDITEREQQEIQLRRAQKMDAIGELTGGIAHDFNNLLGIILGYSEILAERVADDAKLSKYVNQISLAGKRGAKLTKKLLRFSHASETTAEAVFLNELLKDNEDLLAKTLTPRITLTLNFEHDLGLIFIDKNGLEDAILNLTINAMHAMPDGGKLRIKTENISLNRAEGAHYQLDAGDYIRLSITDNGIGMDKATQEKIFDPFFSTKGDKGTGLGMFQVYGLIHKAGGAINIYSALGHGTRVTILLPRYYQNMDNHEKSQISTNDSFLQGNESILVVDDEPALYQLAEDILKSKGYEVETADSAKAALERLSEKHFDLVLSDIIMPKMDGYHLAQEIQQHYPKTKIQLASGFDDHCAIEMADKLLQSNLIHKPYTTTELLTQIRSQLDTPSDAP